MEVIFLFWSVKISSFGDDIRRISKYQELLDLIRQNTNKVNQQDGGAISGSRGIAYSDYTKSTTSTSTSPTNGTVNTAKDVAGEVGREVGTAAAEKAGLDGITNSGGSSDLSSRDNSERDGWYDADSLLDNTKDAYGKSPPVEGALNAVRTITGLLDGTRSMVVHLTDPSLSILAPSSWTSNTEPGSDADWDPNYYYQIDSFAGTSFGSTRASAAKDHCTSLLLGSYNGGLDATCTTAEPTSFDGTTSGTQYIRLVYTSNTSGLVVLDYVYNALWYRLDCIAVGNPSVFCTIAPPDNGWYEDLGATQLGILTTIGLATMQYNLLNVGQFMPHPSDINVPSKYVTGVSILDLTTTGGTNVRIGPLADSGIYMYERDPGAGNAPLGAATANSVYTIGSNGVPTGFITPNQLTTKLP